MNRTGSVIAMCIVAGFAMLSTTSDARAGVTVSGQSAPSVARAGTCGGQACTSPRKRTHAVRHASARHHRAPRRGPAAASLATSTIPAGARLPIDSPHPARTTRLLSARTTGTDWRSGARSGARHAVMPPPTVAAVPELRAWPVETGDRAPRRATAWTAATRGPPQAEPRRTRPPVFSSSSPAPSRLAPTPISQSSPRIREFPFTVRAATSTRPVSAPFVVPAALRRPPAVAVEQARSRSHDRRLEGAAACRQRPSAGEPS